MKHKFALILLFISTQSFARSLKASADKLGTDMAQIGMGLALFGLIIAGIYFLLGKQEASQKMTQVLMGICILFLSPAIVSFIKALA